MAAADIRAELLASWNTSRPLPRVEYLDRSELWGTVCHGRIQGTRLPILEQLWRRPDGAWFFRLLKGDKIVVNNILNPTPEATAVNWLRQNGFLRKPALQLRPGETYILEVLRQTQKPLLAKEIAKKAGLNVETVKQYLRPRSPLRGNGLVAKTPEGYLALSGEV